MRSTVSWILNNGVGTSTWYRISVLSTISGLLSVLEMKGGTRCYLVSVLGQNTGIVHHCKLVQNLNDAVIEIQLETLSMKYRNGR